MRTVVFAAAAGLCLASVVLAQDAPKSAPSSAEQAPAQPAKVELTPLAHVETSGSGPTHMILIPGLSCDWTVWKTFMERNAKLYTMHAVTLPGFGGSQPPPRAEGTELWRDLWLTNAEKAIVAYADQQKLGKPLVMGHSLGSHLAIRLALHQPGRFSGCIGVDGFPAFPLGGAAVVPMESRRSMVENGLKQWVEQTFGDRSHEKVAAMVRTWVSDPARADAIAVMSENVPASTVEGYVLELMAGDLVEQLKQNKTPLLLLAASPPRTDGEQPAAEQSREMARTIWRTQVDGAANTTLEFVADSKHFVMDDQPKALDEDVQKFVAGLK